MSDTSDIENRLSEKWSEFLSKQPETGMDYQTGDVVLNDGHTIKDVAFVGSTIIGEVKGYANIPFDPNNISEIRLTHKRWQFKR